MQSKDRKEFGFVRGRTLALAAGVAVVTTAFVVVMAQDGGGARSQAPAADAPKPAVELKVEPAIVAREASSYVVGRQAAEQEEIWWETQQMYGSWYSSRATVAGERPAETVVTLLGGGIMEAEDLETGKFVEGKWSVSMKGLELSIADKPLLFEFEMNAGVNGFAAYNPETYGVMRFNKRDRAAVAQIRNRIEAQNRARRGSLAGIWVGDATTLPGATGKSIFILNADGTGEQRNSEVSATVKLNWSIRGNTIAFEPVVIPAEILANYTLSADGKKLDLSIAGAKSSLARLSDMEYSNILSAYNRKKTEEVNKMIAEKMKAMNEANKPTAGWTMSDWLANESKLIGTWRSEEAQLVGGEPGPTTLQLMPNGTCIVTNTKTNTTLTGVWGFKQQEIRLTLNNGDDLKKPLELPEEGQAGGIKIDGKEFKKG